MLNSPQALPQVTSQTLAPVPASSQVLAQLKDIYLPPPISWWPLAPGGYCVILLLIAIVVGGIIFAWQVYARGKTRRVALRLLAEYEAQYQQHADATLMSVHISELLRRVALVYFPRESVAGLQGEAWIAFLNRTGNGIDFTVVKSCLLELPYQTDPVLCGDLPSRDMPLLLRCAKQWITKQRRRAKCLN